MPNNDPVYQTVLNDLNGYLRDAKDFGDTQANCCFLATSGKAQQPSVRIITIYDINESGFLFLANKNSGKIIQLTENPKVGICFYWEALKMQATIEGVVEELIQEKGEELWRRRNHDAQITAWALDMAADQKDQKEDVDNIEEYKLATKQRFKESKPPLPASWSAYAIKPNRIELWHTDWRKSKKRECYTKRGGYWHKSQYYN